MVEIKIQHPTTIGKVELPTSKSITNRLLIINELSHNKMLIKNSSISNDSVVLERILQSKSHEVDAEDAGTVARFATAYFASTEGEKTINCSSRMKERPMKHLIEALRNLGAKIEYIENEGYLPVKIYGKKLTGGKIQINGNVSSQFLSALLLIAPTLEQPLELNIEGDIVSMPYLTMTLSLLESFGIETNAEDFYQGDSSKIIVSPGLYQLPNEFTVEGDWSAASYWYAAAALSEHAEIELKGLHQNSIQGDSVLPFLFDTLGVTTTFTRDGIIISKTGEIEIEEFDFDFTDNPDLAMTMAVVCSGLKIPATLTGLSTLVNKESNRIKVLQSELEKFNVITKIVDESSLEIDPSHFSYHSDVQIDTHNDHRIAMAFTSLVLKCKNLRIENQNVVNKSYPTFWADVENIYKTSTLQFSE